MFIGWLNGMCPNDRKKQTLFEFKSSTVNAQAHRMDEDIGHGTFTSVFEYNIHKRNVQMCLLWCFIVVVAVMLVLATFIAFNCDI